MIKATVAAGVFLLACCAGGALYFLRPYEVGPATQTWSVLVTRDGGTGTSSGFGLGKCGDEGPHGASQTKAAALARACFSAGLCPGDSVCDCSAVTSFHCEEGQVPGRTRLGDLITVPIH